MKVWTLVSSALGVAFTLWLLSTYGFNQVVLLMITAGWAIPAIAVFHVTQIVASANGWRMVTEEHGLGLTLRTYSFLRWIREAVNNLLPVAQLGGVAVGTRLLAQRGVRLPDGVAGAIVDTTMEFISQIAFTLVGLGLLFLSAEGRDLGQIALAAVLTTGMLGVGLLAAQWLGLAKILEWTIGKLGKTWGRTGPNEATGLHDAIMEIYRSPRRITLGFLFHFAAWVLGAVEIYISLRALGYESPISACVIIEAVGQALKSAGFAVPASIGVQEGGYVLAGAVFGVPAEVGIALSLIKRLRDVVLGLPAFAAWHWLERKSDVAPIASP
jgi:putative membrane protein